ncbi:MAG TPA: hypothetical protein PLH94_14850 [Fimbriimonadaceae bacterium]|nr:hypothetical protein [Fimbriimonadaceae bacterium]
MRVPVATILVLILLSLARAQPTALLELSNTVVIAETIAVERGLPGVDLRDPSAPPKKFARFTLRIIASIKGEATGQIDVAVHEPLMEDLYGGNGYFSGKIGLKSLWGLQHRPDGVFRDEDRNRWQVEGFVYSPIEYCRYQAELVETEFRRSGDPLVDLAELFAVNWARRPRGYGMYVEQIQLIDPSTGPRGRIRPPDDPTRIRLGEWLDRRLPEILGERSAEGLVNEYALRLSWGQKEYSKRFTDLYLANPQSLKSGLPGYVDPSDLMRIFLASDRILCAQLAASITKSMPVEDRVSATRKVIPYLGVNRGTDIAFLNALADWWSRPDLSPLERGRAKDDLAPLIEQARRLLDR